MMLIERRGDADNDHIHLRDFRVFRRSAEAGLLRHQNFTWENANDVGPAGV